MTTYASGRPAATKPQAQGERMSRTRMQAARWQQELSDKNAAQNLSLSFRPELLSSFCSERAPHKKTAPRKPAWLSRFRSQPLDQSSLIKVNQGWKILCDLF
jgi:hypothetical protein